MAAIQTTLTLKDDVSKRLRSIEKRVKSLAKTMGAFNNGVVTAGKRMETFSKRIDKVTQATKKFGNTSKDINKVNNSLKSTGHYALSAKSGVDNLTSSVKRLAGAYLSVMTIGNILDTADAITGATNKLSTVYKMENPNATDADTKVAVQGQMDDIFASAQRSRSDYNATMQNVGKMLINAGDTFEGNLDKAIAFNELMAKSYTIGGASATEQETSMYQLIQALGSGTLAGDELRSVREGAQVAYKYIEEYAQELFGVKTSLKDLAADGLITSDIVTNAILEKEKEINAMFNATQVTFEQTWTMMANNFIKAFEPVLQQFTTLLNNEDFQDMLTALTAAFVGMATMMLNALEWISQKWNQLTNFIRENKDFIISTVIPAVLLLIAVWLAWKTIAVITSLIVNWQLVLVILAIVAVISAVVYLANEFGVAGEVIGGIIGGIVQLIINLAASIWNTIVETVVGVINFILNIINSFYQMFSGGFLGFIEGLVELIWSFVDLVIDAVGLIARAIDTIFGTSLSGVIDSFQKGARDLIDSISEDEAKVGVDLLTPEDYDKWILKPQSVQDGVKNGIEKGAEIEDALKELDVEALIGGLTNNPFGGNDWETTIGNALDGSGTGDNIGNIADTIELTKEDLAYLRELAEMEAINKFTTAEIKVDMSNYNTINGENDLDGLFTKLSEKLEEEMHVVADGVY